MANDRANETNEERGTICAIVSAYNCEPNWLTVRVCNLLDSTRPPDKIMVGVQTHSQEAEEVSYLMDKFDGTVVFQATAGIPGLYETWNNLIDEVYMDYDYMTNANTDDEVYQTGLERMAELLDRNADVDVAYGDQDIRYKSPVEKPVDKFDWAEGGYKRLKESCFLSPMPMWRAQLHRDGYWFDPKLKVVGDYDFWLRIARDGKRFMKVYGEPVGVYTAREDSLAHKYGRIAVIEESKIMEGHKDEEM